MSFNNTSETETATTYLWNFGDGTTSVSANPVHVYENPGTYSVTLTMNTTGYCSQELMLTQSGLVEVQAIPNAGFDITPNQVDILNPVIEYETLATGNVLCYYNFGDGGSSSDCSGTYTFSDGGYFDVVQTVINEAGCTNTALAKWLFPERCFLCAQRLYAGSRRHQRCLDSCRPRCLGLPTQHLQPMG